MTETPVPYDAGMLLPIIDPRITRICQLLFYRAISIDEAARQLVELQQKRLREFQAGWIAVEFGNGYEVLMQEDELYRQEEFERID